MKKIIVFSMICFMAFSLVAQDKVGVQLYSFRNQFKTDVPGTLKAIKGMGITYVEGGDSYGLPIKDIKMLLAENNFQVISVGCDYNELKNDPMSIVEKAKAYGASFAMCPWIPHPEGPLTIELAKEAVMVFNKAGKVLKDNGIDLVYHAHGYEFLPYEDGTIFDYMAKNMDPKVANFEMDVYWISHPGQDPVKMLQKYPGRFLLMHLKDRKPGTPGNMLGRADVETNVVLGTGDLGIEAIVKAGRKAGVKYYFIEDESSRSMDQVPQSLAYLKKI
ncbi:MAG TPA: sugar phosphate isomerase/epimerase [Chitinophagaceae bacterium]|nr:sugar phosphate isomerase/epimerase [Chitinophagaceae bacterium]